MVEQMSEIEIYKGKNDQTHVEVKFDQETVWLSQKQMAQLFAKNLKTVNEHIKNIYKEREVEKISTIRNFRIVQEEGKRTIEREVEHYNLDVIISVGYRVKSKQGTQFRQWATHRLRDYLIKGYAINEQRLRASQRQLTELKKSMILLEHVVKSKKLTSDEAVGLLKVVTAYSRALDLLDRYDHQQLQIPKTKRVTVKKLTYAEAIKQIKLWRDKHKAGKLFGNEKDQSFHSSLQTIYQTFDGAELYPSLHEKAANLLYFVVKNHSFTDGNKRIAAGLFLYFLDKNKQLYAVDGSKIMADNTLVAITIMIAESNPDDKDMMIKLIVNLMQSM
jgi:prophage maintenance system killer protein